MLKHIVLHSPTVDNVNGYHDAGAELTVGDAAKAGVISLDRAQELVDSGRAVSRTEAKAQTTKRSVRRPAKRTAKKPAAKISEPTPPAQSVTTAAQNAASNAPPAA
jgi:hypothetical protein